MTPFLNIVARDLMEKTHGDFSNITIVFPNKRASLFFNKALQDLLTDSPMWSPAYTTISELFRQHSQWEIADHIKLVCELYESYRSVTGSPETLDQFYAWGELMLADFDDIDKHEADVSKVFSLLGDIHELDNVDYLTDKQMEVLQQFFRNFTKDHTTHLKERFLQLWIKFKDIYEDYYKRLAAQGIAYEGMLYRNVIESLTTQPDSQNPQSSNTYVFVGFNLLNTVEQKLFTYYKIQGRAKFYWDFDHYYMDSEAGCFISNHLKAFPNELPLDHPTYNEFIGPNKDITVCSSPTNDLQARYVSEWLTQERIDAGRKTAIVLADESLLETVLHCLPEQVKHVNITTGYPLSLTPVATLVRLTTSLYSKATYTLHNVNAVLRHSLIPYVSPMAEQLHQQLNQNVIYYPTLDDLSLDENLTTFFSPLKQRDDCTELNDRLMWIVKSIARNTNPKDALQQESLYRMYTVLNRLSNLSLKEWSTQLYIRLLQQIIQTTTIPFHGEPIEGIQIMGVLETRNLDFEHILVLSCNEGNIPASVNDTSFIPHSIRRAYGLTTIENKVSIYAYYFHRILQRATDASIVYNGSTSNGQTGEMSRFILQLMAESPINITCKALQSGQETHTHTAEEVQKSDDIIRRLITPHEGKEHPYFSPTELGCYLRCPMRFFFRHVVGINDLIEGDEEEMNNVSFGNIFHRAAELFYEDKKNSIITESVLTNALEGKNTGPTITDLVDQAFREELFKIKDEPSRKTPRLGGLQIINREMVIKFLRQLLEYDRRNAPFTILGTEKWATSDIDIQFQGHPFTVTIGGKIDRLDKLVMKNPDGSSSEHVRIIDYKTGRLTKALNQTSIEDIFNTEKMPDHADYFLQAMMYSSIVADPASSLYTYTSSQKSKLPPQTSEHPITPALLFVQNAKSEDYSPLLTLGTSKGPKTPILDASGLLPEYLENVKALIERILDKQQPFTKTTDAKQCEYCPFFNLCK